MTKEHEYNGEKFTVSKPDDCVMKVTKDGCTAHISLGQPGMYEVAISDAKGSYTVPTMR